MGGDGVGNEDTENSTSKGPGASDVPEERVHFILRVIEDGVGKMGEVLECYIQ